MKALIFDSGSLITLSMNGLLYILEGLKSNFKGKFIITESVKYEIIDRPIKVPRFELGALRIQNLIDAKIIELPNSLNIDSQKIKKETTHFMELANHCLKIRDNWLRIVSDAESSCLALSKILSNENIENIIVIDERTTRILTEKPENLRELMQQKLHSSVELFQENLKEFKNFKFIRSTELVYAAFKEGFLKLQGPKALEAALYATKYKGSSVSFDEINVLKKL